MGHAHVMSTNFLDFIDPLPPCQIQESADFVPFCLLFEDIIYECSLKERACANSQGTSSWLGSCLRLFSHRQRRFDISLHDMFHRSLPSLLSLCWQQQWEKFTRRKFVCFVRGDSRRIAKHASLLSSLFEGCQIAKFDPTLAQSKEGKG